MTLSVKTTPRGNSATDLAAAAFAASVMAAACCFLAARASSSSSSSSDNATILPAAIICAEILEVVVLPSLFALSLRLIFPSSSSSFSFSSSLLLLLLEVGTNSFDFGFFLDTDTLALGSFFSGCCGGSSSSSLLEDLGMPPPSAYCSGSGSDSDDEFSSESSTGSGPVCVQMCSTVPVKYSPITVTVVGTIPSLRSMILWITCMAPVLKHSVYTIRQASDVLFLSCSRSISMIKS
ncbi:hypothetical protein [Cyprinid herpesvirus 2]|nr:hypothetical protein [Cyprinid herpesvirus 2]